MTYRNTARPPLPEAAMQAMADVLVSTDELDEEYDAHGRYERWPHGVGWGWRSELNTGVVHFRATNGSLAFVQAWRRAMLAKRQVLNTNDQFIFCAMVRDAGMERVTASAAHMSAWRASLAAHGLLREQVLRTIGPTTRGVSISRAGFELAVPCLPKANCAPARFTLGTLPLRAFTGGHTYFMQRVHNFDGHALARARPLTVHFTFQYSDTRDYPHGKRQRAREAGCAAACPHPSLSNQPMLAPCRSAREVLPLAPATSTPPPTTLHCDSPPATRIDPALWPTYLYLSRVTTSTSLCTMESDPCTRRAPAAPLAPRSPPPAHRLPHPQRLGRRPAVVL